MSLSTPESQTFERKVAETEKKTLTYYTEKTNQEAREEKTENLFMHLSIKEIMLNLSAAFIGILNDLMEPGKKDYIKILTKDDRMIYVGLVLLFFAFSMYLIDITN